MVELNPEQIDAANFLNGVCALVAIPGSGKTLTMTERIGMLVKNHGIAPENILGLTFTKSAAETMRSSLLPVLNDRAHRVHLATIHSFCHYLLRQESRVFELLTGKDQIVFLRTIMKQLRVKDISVGMVLREISLSKNNLITLEEFKTLYGEHDKTMLKIASIWERYDSEKQKKMLLDFDDLLIETYTILSENEDIRDKYRSNFKHLLVDEYQDINPVHMEILKLLVDDSSDSSFFVVGDDAQSIFGFSSASIWYILNFKNLYPTAEQKLLTLNYRSTPQILKACHNLIQHNTRKIDKELKTDNPDGEDVIILESSSEVGEALNVVNEIKDLVNREYEYKDIAVLYRANFQSMCLEEAFSQHKIPYHIENGLNFYQRYEVKVLLDYLRLINNPLSEEGDESLLGMINIPNRYIGRKFIKELETFSSDNEIHLYEGLKSMPVELPYVRKNVKEFIEFLDPLITDAENLEPAEVIQLIRDTLDYDRCITDSDIPTPDDVKVENINQLQLAATKYSTIDSFLQYTDSFKDVSSQDKEGVSLKTVHKVKGEEYPVVFVVGLVEGIMPSKRGNLEEERRICFVACSRAMNLLYLSHSLTYMSVPAKKSLFLDEILGK